MEEVTRLVLLLLPTLLSALAPVQLVVLPQQVEANLEGKIAQLKMKRLPFLDYHTGFFESFSFETPHKTVFTLINSSNPLFSILTFPA